MLSHSAPPLKRHVLKHCASWRETCLASVFALRLATQRARAASRLCSDTCLITRLRVSMIPTLRQRRKGNRGNHSICSARAFRSPLKVPRAKALHFWRETCLASVFALRLATQRARAANRSAKDIVRLVPSQLKLRNKSTRSVLPFKLCYSSFSWNRTIVSQKI